MTITTADPCGGATKDGDGCRCDPPFNQETPE